MKNLIISKSGVYAAPSLEVLDFAVENGFELSTVGNSWETSIMSDVAWGSATEEFE